MTDQPKIVWQPHPGKQTTALQRTEKEILLGGARFGGKSDTGRIWLLRPFKDYPNSVHLYRALVIRENSKDLRGWVDKAMGYYEPLGARAVGNPPIIKFKNGAKFYVGHLADENSYKHYLSDEFQRVLFEELTLVPKEISYLMVLGSCRTTCEIAPQILCTTNPGNAGHVWVSKRWDIPKGKPPYPIKTVKLGKLTEGVFIPMNYKDNPTGMKNDPFYEDYLNNLPEPLRSAWRDGDWSVFAGMYFTELSQADHGIEPFEIPKHWDLVGGLDYGETAPTSFGLYTVDTTNNWIIRIGEYYKPGRAASESARNIIQFCKDNPWTGGRLPSHTYADPSMEVKRRIDEVIQKSPEDIFNEYGLYLKLANNDRIGGWRVCKEALHETRRLQGEFINPEEIPISSKLGFKYFLGENPTFEELIPAQLHDKNKVEDVLKCDIDHIADEWRYLMIMLRGKGVSVKEFQAAIEERDIERKAQGRMFETLDESINTH